MALFDPFQRSIISTAGKLKLKTSIWKEERNEFPVIGIFYFIHISWKKRNQVKQSLKHS